MSKTALYLDGESVPLITDISIPTSYVISDVEDPSSRDANHTKTVELPSTKELDQIFEFAHNPNISLQSFNPNLKTPVRFTNNGITVLDGNLKLNRIRTNRNTGAAFYNCEIKGLVADLFTEIGESLLTDLDFSAYDHALTKTNVVNSWSAANGTGYKYFLADYGYSTSGINEGSQKLFRIHHLRPALYAYEYLTKIFTAAGKTFTSTFLSAAFFKSLIIPGTKPVALTDTDFEERQFLAGLGYMGTGGAIPLTSIPLTFGGATWTGGPATTEVVPFPDESTFPNNDPGSIYDNTVYECTVGANGNYTIYAHVLTDFSFTHSGSGVNYDGDWDIRIRLQQYIGAVWTTVLDSNVHTGTTASFTGASAVLTLSLSQFMSTGDKYRIVVRHSVNNLIISDSGGTPITTGTASYLVNINDFAYLRSQFKLELQNDYIYEGDDLVMSEAVPPNIKQKDFLKSIIQMFHLYVLEDKTDRNNYLIEPRISFFSSTVQDWTSKVDITNDVEQEMIDFAKTYSFQYKSDNDYYNKQYQDKYNEAYGKYKYDTQTEFNTEENKTDIIFSPTPLVGNLNNGLRIPHIYKNEGGVVTPTSFNIRILIWGGMKAVNGDDWNCYSDSAGDDTMATYPYAGHINDPYTPTLDLCFDNPKEVFYNGYPSITYTNVNLGSEYHAPYLDQLSNKDSRLIRCYVKLDEWDILKFDFRDKKHIDGVTCVVNAIRNFDVSQDKTTLVEFLKLVS